MLGTSADPLTGSKEMKLHHIGSLVLLAAGSWAALGQPGNPFLGTWSATWSGANKAQRATLVITESGGSWRTVGSSKTNPCIGREAPIAIESSSAKKIVFNVKFSEAYTGCSDSKVVLIRADDGAVTGKRGRFDLTLSRD